MIFVGIDPGASGGIAWLEAADEPRLSIVLRVGGAKMPETERDTWDGFAAFRANPATLAVIEHVHSMPKQGVASSFKFGRSYGFLRCCLVASEIPFEEVRAAVWQKELGCLSRGNKNVTKRKAQQLFPNVKITHAIADALLLAEYARRLWHRHNAREYAQSLA